MYRVTLLHRMMLLCMCNNGIDMQQLSGPGTYRLEIISKSSVTYQKVLNLGIFRTVRLQEQLLDTKQIQVRSCRIIALSPSYSTYLGAIFVFSSGIGSHDLKQKLVCHTIICFRTACVAIFLDQKQHMYYNFMKNIMVIG